MQGFFVAALFNSIALNIELYLSAFNIIPATNQHVRTWKNVLPTFGDGRYAFGGGKAIIDLEILFGKNSGKKESEPQSLFMKKHGIEKRANTTGKQHLDEKCIKFGFIFFS